MPTMQVLETTAINAAKKSDWAAAINANLEILNSSANNIPALNRLGFAYLQLGKLRKASQTFNEVLELDKSNLIAKRQLENIKNKIITTPQFQAQNFVEEPSKSKIIALNRLASKQILESLHVGQELVLKPKSRFISVETLDKQYLGSMPEDISLRLSKLIIDGNRYLCQLHSSSSNSCTIFVRETYQAPANRHRLSFASVYQADKEENIGSDLLLLTDDVPMDIIQDEMDDSDKDSAADDD
ncbi:MAG: tetratricopeptide repeat protein [bacterium]|nr:tetratricopeptide repeat protein [bacterium]